MKPVLKAIAFFLLPTVVIMVFGAAIFIGFGALLARWFQFSLFQAAGLAIGATVAVASVIHVVTGIMRSNQFYDLGNDFEYDEEESDPIEIVSTEPDFSKAKRNDYCPCGSGKKFKNCCENITIK